MAVAEALGAEVLGVARTAVDLLVGSVTGYHGVQRAMALAAVEALLVPHLSQTQHSSLIIDGRKGRAF